MKYCGPRVSPSSSTSQTFSRERFPGNQIILKRKSREAGDGGAYATINMGTGGGMDSTSSPVCVT